MDPLSVSSSITGLITAAHQVSYLIWTITAGKKTGCREIHDVKMTIDTLKPVLGQLKELILSRTEVDPKRASLILVDQVVATLSACVMTFSDLHGSVNGLLAEDKLGTLDSIRWISKRSELTKYLRKLEAHKASLTLMLSILTCESARNAETAAGELKGLMGQILDTNALILERMSVMETTIARSAVARRDDECTSVLTEQTIRTSGNPASSTVYCEGSKSLPIRYTFEEDLRLSWVYQRVIAKDPRPLSTATSTKLTQSWSILSGLSLSAISNIAVYSLPIFENDLQNSTFYRFGEKGEADTGNKRIQEVGKMSKPTRKSLNKMIISDPTLISTTSTQVHLAVHLPSSEPIDRQNLQNRFLKRIPGQLTFPDPLRQQKPSVRDDPRSVSTAIISKPTLISTSSTQLLYARSTDNRPKLGGNSINTTPVQRKAPETSDRDEPSLSQKPSISPSEGNSHDCNTSSRLSVNADKSPDMGLESSNVRLSVIIDKLHKRMDAYGGRLASPTQSNHSSIKSTRHASEPISMPLNKNRASDTPSFRSLPLATPVKNSPLPPIPLPMLRQISRRTVALIECNTSLTRPESGYPYLTYKAGEVFDVVGKRGELYLAKKLLDPYTHLGWVLRKHFTKHLPSIESSEASFTGKTTGLRRGSLTTIKFPKVKEGEEEGGLALPRLAGEYSVTKETKPQEVDVKRNLI